MKKVVFGLFALALVALFAFKGTEEGKEKYPTIELGAKMPKADYVMMNTTGDKYVLKEALGKNGALVVFSCNACPFVVQWEDRYNDLAEICTRLGIGMVLINSNEAKREGDDSFDKMKEHAEEMSYKMPYLVDKNSELANAFGAKTTPHVFLFDSKAKLVYKGAIDDNSKDATAVEHTYLKDAIHGLVYENGNIEVPETPAKGCSIKRLDN
ncbi:MAG: redoxin domain-containing protein [Chitinophagales bacterium]|nr:redoxin domain-containing protein [Chitinophagales bacterium]